MIILIIFLSIIRYLLFIKKNIFDLLKILTKIKFNFKKIILLILIALFKINALLLLFFNVLYIFNININFLFINKFFDIDIVIIFYKIDYNFIKNDLKFINIYNRDLFFLNF